MVNAVYDHIIAILVICVMFVGAVVVLPTLSAANIKAVDQQQLRNIALNVFNTILLDTGEPVDWGLIGEIDSRANAFDESKVTRFGLACQESTLFVLDPNKVQRLDPANPVGGIRYARVKELLGLHGYGFSFRIIPPFNVTVLEIITSDVALSYKVKVSYLDGRPIPNARASATIVYTSEGDFKITTSRPPPSNTLGVIEDTVQLSFKPRYVTVILKVTVADVATLIVTFGSKPIDYIAKINMVGDTVILTWPDRDIQPRPVRRIFEGYAYTSDGTLVLFYNNTSVTSTDNMINYGLGSPFRIWNKTFRGLSGYDPVVLIFNVWTVPEGGGGIQEVVIAGPYRNLLGYTVLHYGGSPASASATVRIQRSVIISGMTYIAELTLWKESP